MTPSLSTACASAAEPTREALDAVVQHLLAAPDDAARRSQLLAALADFPAAALLIHLKTASEHYFTVNARQSLCLADALIVAAELSAQPQHRALGLLARGDALRTLGQYQEAHDTFEEAGAAFLALNDEVGWARTRTSWLPACYFLGRSAEALPVMDQAYAVLERHGELGRAAALDQNTAIICELMGHYDDALWRYERAEATFARQGNAVTSGLARVKANKARLLSLFGEFRRSLALHEEARAAFQMLGASLSVHREDQYIADVLASQGDYTQALHRYAEALDAFNAEGLAPEINWTALGMIECYLRLNRLADASALADEAIIACERHGTPTEAAKARFACALVLARLDERELAAAQLEAAASVFRATSQTSYEGAVALHRALLHLGDGEWEAARVEATRAKTNFAQRNLPVRQAQANLLLARAQLALHDIAAAEDVARCVLDVSEERSLAWLAQEANAVIAGIARTRNNLPAALMAYDAAIANIDQLQSRLAVELRTTFLADKLQVYHEALDCCLRLPEPDLQRAFAYLERAKARALVDYLASNPTAQAVSRDPSDGPLLEELRRLRAEHDWFLDRLYGHGLARRPTGDSNEPPSGEEAATLLAQVQAREGQIARLQERLALRQHAGQTELSSAAISSEEIRQRLDSRTMLLEYHLQHEGGVVFLLTNDQLTVAPLLFRLPELHRLLQRWQLNLTATARALLHGHSVTTLEENATMILRALYRLLLAPIVEKLTDYDRLIIIPTGPLHQLPFHALHDGERFVLDRWEVVVAPSSSLWALCAARPPRPSPGALVLAHSNDGQLPAAVTEALLVSMLLPGTCCLEDQATRDMLSAHAPRHRILHLAAHGEARLDNPLFAFVRLADGRLTPSDIFALDLDGMLVVLSACESGRAAVQGGDELIGLSRAFLHAGAATLVQSLWRIEDAITAQLMTHFYDALSGGASVGTALRSAQRALRQGGSPLYGWAAFQLLGNAGLIVGEQRLGARPRESEAQG